LFSLQASFDKIICIDRVLMIKSYIDGLAESINVDFTFRTKGGNMKSRKLAILLVIACMLVLLADQTALGATKIVKLTVPGCQ